MNRGAGRSEDGSSLLLALVFILALGLGISAMMSYLYAGLSASGAVRDQGRDVYAVDAAVESVIAQLRLSQELGQLGTACGPFTSTVNGRSITVDCEPLTLANGKGSRTTYTTGGGGSGLPAGALVALGGEGISLQNNGTKTLTVKGDAYSNGPVVVSNGAVGIDGVVHAPSCGGSGTLTNISTPPVTPVCDTALPSPATDPGWTLTGVTQPSAATLGTGYCNGPAVPAGTYTNAADWAALVSSCNGTLTFSGIYYLDFADAVGCGTAGSARQWCVLNNNASLVAGVSTADGTCTSEGALFVLGGETRITVRAGSLQLCGVTVGGGPTLSVYAKSPPPIAPPEPTPGSVTLKPTAGKSTGNPAFANEANATTINGVVATASESQKAKTKTATITLSALAGTIPSTATITKVSARVAHRESATTGASVDAVTLTVKSGSTKTFSLTPRSALGTDLVDVTTAGLTAVNAASATLTVEVTGTVTSTASASWTADVDGVELDVEYTVPALPPPVPWSTLTCAIAPCTVLDTDGSNTRASFLGTIYTPTSKISLNAVNNALAAAARGIVARTVEIHVPTLVDISSFHISLPGGGPTVTHRHDGFVRLTARVTGDPLVRLQAEVTLPDGSRPTRAIISNWTVT